MKRKNYQAYLIRLKREAVNDAWRVTLRNVHADEVVHFGTPQAFIQFLISRLAVSNTEQEIVLTEMNFKESDADAV